MAESFWAELPLGLSMTLAKDPVAKGVFDGLSPEERIVVEGYHKLQHGMKVEPVAPIRREDNATGEE